MCMCYLSRFVLHFGFVLSLFRIALPQVCRTEQGEDAIIPFV